MAGTNDSQYDDVIFWDCRESDVLTCCEIDTAIEDWLDDIPLSDFPKLPDYIEVKGYRRSKIGPETFCEPGGILERLLEWMDESYGRPDTGTEPTEVMKAAERMFVEMIISEYEVWACDHVRTHKVHVMNWIKRFRPELIAELAAAEIKAIKHTCRDPDCGRVWFGPADDQRPRRCICGHRMKQEAA